MKTRGLALAAGALMGMSSMAMAQFTAFSAGPHDSNGPAGSPFNGFFEYNYGGAAFQVGNILFTGTATSTGIGSYRSELRYRAVAPNGMFFDSAAVAAGTTWVGDEFVSSNQNANALGIQGSGMWRFEFWESYDDGGTGAVDAIWTNVTFDVQAGVAPPPPPPSFGGSFVGTPNVLQNGVAVNGSTIWTGSEVGLTRGAGEAANSTRYTGFGWDLVGNEVGYRIDHGGGQLRLDLTNLTADLDMVLLDSSGLPVNTVAVSQGFGGTTAESIDLENLEAGTYYAVVDTFGASSLGGDYTLTYIPAPGAVALLGMGGLLAARRRR